MKNKKTLSLLVPLAVAAMTFVACSDYDNGVTEKQIQFDRNFKERFTDIDPEQDWNLAERSGVTVVTSTERNIKIYAEQNGDFNILGNYKKVLGSQKLSFDMYEGTQVVVVSDGETAMRAYVGGTVNFDDHTSVAGDAQETRSHDVNRNEWEDKGYIVPNPITDEERDAVIAAFSIPHYGAVNTVTIPWNAIWVQQVYRSGVKYTDGDGGTVTGSDHMNHLHLYNNKVAVNDTTGMRSEHVNDFNVASHNSSWQDIVGLTLMYDIDPTNVMTEVITDAYGQEKTWVKQWAYHNSTDSKYHFDYIYKMVGNSLYIGFDFYAHGTDLDPANKNEDVERDWVFNDWILKVAPAFGNDFPQESIPEATPVAWVLACEDLGSTDDVDYNDVVVKVEHVSGEENAYVTPLAAGGTLASYLYFTSSADPSVPQCVGEIHQLFNTNYRTKSGSYSVINVGSSSVAAPQRYPVPVGGSWSLACYSTADWDDGSQHAATNMGGFSIKVLPYGAAAADMKIPYGDDAFNGSSASVIQGPTPGSTPYIVCLPYSYVDAETSEKNLWAWPDERDDITDAYANFSGWVQDHTSNRNWFTAPNSKFVVNKNLLQSISRLINKQSSNQTAINEAVNAATLVAYGQLVGVPEWKRMEIPAPVLKLKDGFSGIYLAKGETVDLYDYIDTNFPIYCDISSTGVVNYANTERTKIVSEGAEGNTTTITIKQYSINGTSIQVTAGTMQDTGFKIQSGGNDVSGSTIELKANEEKTIEAWWQNCSEEKASLDVSITDNGSGTTFTRNGKNIVVKAGSTFGKTETLTVNFSADGPYYPATKTVNIKVVEAPKQTSNMYAQASNSTMQPGGTITINAANSTGGEITYEVSPSNAGMMNGNQFTANTNFTGDVDITVKQAATSTYGEKESTVRVNVQKLNPNFGLSAYTATVNVGGTETITIYTGSDANISVRSENEGVATVSRSGNAITITGVAVGNTNILVHQEANNTYQETNTSIYVNVETKDDTDHGAYVSQSAHDSYTFTVEAGSTNGTYTIKYGGNPVKSNVSSLILYWSEYTGAANSVSMYFRSPGYLYNHVEGAAQSKSVTIYASDLENCKNNNGQLLIYAMDGSSTFKLQAK